MHSSEDQANGLTEELLASGLPLEVHQRLRYREVSTKTALDLVGINATGWVVPMCSPGGEQYLHEGKPFFRFKPHQGQLKGENPPKYVSPKGGGCRPYFSTLMPANSLADGKPLRITEGEKKTDCLNHYGLPTIGISGVDAWTDKRVEPRQFIPELETINWSGRDVFLVFDSDVTIKDSVRASLYRLTDALSERGAQVFVVLLPCELNGDKNGVDDFIYRHGADAYRALERISRPACKSRGKGKNCSRKWWEPEPPQIHHKALTACTVLDGIYANRLNHGLYQWNNSHWELIKGKDREALKRPLHQWMDEMGWHKRGDSVIGSMVSEILARLEKTKWDCDGFMAFANGTLRQDIFTPGHKPNDSQTFCFPFNYDPESTCPRWHQFLKETLGADDLIRLLRAAIRWTLIPKQIDAPFTHELVFDVHGPRRAGKGTLSEVLQAICGGSAGVGLIRSQSFCNPNALHSLIGKRIALDPDASGHVSDPGVFNSISSNEKVEVKKLYKDADSARLGVVIWRFFNDSPTASGGGIEGMGRRIVTFRFEKSVTNPDEELKLKLINEAAGIFWWAWSMSDSEMNDALRNRGKVLAIREASIEAALERDHILRFSVSNPGEYKAAELYRLYSRWITEEGQHPISATKFGREIKKLPWVEHTKDWKASYYKTHQPTQQDLALHIGITIESSRSGDFNPPAEQTHQPNTPEPQSSTEAMSQASLVSLVSSSSEKKGREEELEKGEEQQRESEVQFRPTRPTSVPVYVDGHNGWTSPTSLIPKAGLIVLIDELGITHSVNAKQVSLYPPKTKQIHRPSNYSTQLLVQSLPELSHE
ncbi:DUF3854 domain-containing protein [Prochlorococcus sp. MIT 1303]|uniref:DUF3854 domain-containing protein n=1 Tax=Prochlorococcus sp. MIT 1303 TaxID=1723647 RepID=UPI0007B3B5FC|nr:DUF3854 domain-containing protein [Prochlorococcus sp. MIT 1303]KZR67722.1 hypothetical protein PMIT1303_00434 [Prochlorococcus sp. MIT 1303]